MRLKSQRFTKDYRRGRTREQVATDAKERAVKARKAKALEQSQFEARRAERLARVKADQEAKEAKERTRRAEVLKRSARAGWLRDGGTPETFDEAWPEMYETILKEKATAAALSGRGDDLTAAVRAVSAL